MACGVSSSKTTAASTQARASSTSTRSALGFMRPRRPLVGAHRAVGVHPDDQGVAERARGLQVADVAGMQQVEHAVREDDRSALAHDARRESRAASCALTAVLDGCGLSCGRVRSRTRTPPENVQPCFGRKKPTSFTRDVTRKEYSSRW